MIRLNCWLMLMASRKQLFQQKDQFLSGKQSTHYFLFSLFTVPEIKTDFILNLPTDYIYKLQQHTN